METAEILKKPYARVVVPESDGSFTAEFLEFPGCVANGDSAASALASVEEVALDWVEAELEQGHDIPEPLDVAHYSGKLVVRMPQGLHKRATQAAMREGVSLNQFIVTCIAEQVGTRARSIVLEAKTHTVAFLTPVMSVAHLSPVSVCGPIALGQLATSANTTAPLITGEREKANA